MKIIRAKRETTYADVQSLDVFTDDHSRILIRTGGTDWPVNLQTGHYVELNADTPVTIYPNAVMLLEPDAPTDADDENMDEIAQQRLQTSEANMRELIALRARVEKLRTWESQNWLTDGLRLVAKNALAIMEGEDES